MRNKVRPRGAGRSAPYLDVTAKGSARDELRQRIVKLCPNHSFDEATIDELCSALGDVNEKFLSEWAQPEALPLARRLARAARELEQLSTGLAGMQTGFRSAEDTEFAKRVREAIACDPRIGNLSRANDHLDAFQRQCAEMSQACWLALKFLKQERGTRGRPQLDWFDDFTALLLKLAKVANTEPTLNKDRGTKARGGWLFKAARALEYFLWPDMRSPTPEACGKRLERSRKKLLTSSIRQNTI